LVGDFSVGKTSLTQKFVKNVFSEQYLTTVGVKIDTKEVKDLKLIIWDMAGRDSLSPINVNYLVGAAAVILVADGTRKETLGALSSMQVTVSEKIGNVPHLVAVNKYDDKENWQLSDQMVENILVDQQPYFYTSAKTGLNVEELFESLYQMLKTN